jgi:exosortase N
MGTAHHGFEFHSLATVEKMVKIAVPDLKASVQLLPIAAIPLILMALQISGYFMGEAGVWLGWLLTLWVLMPDRQRPPQRYLLPAALLLMVMAALIPVRTLLFLSGFVLWLSAVSARYGRLSRLGLVLGVAMSPFYFVAGQVFTFPLRLRMTQWTAAILNTLGAPVRAEGNLLVAPDQTVFAVEPACEGLALLQTTTLLVIFLLAYEKKRSGRHLSAVGQTALLLNGILLAFVANLVRMATLVGLRIAPGTATHDLVGLMAMMCYALLPQMVLGRLVFRRWGIATGAPAAPDLPPFRRTASMVHGLLTIVFVVQIFFFKSLQPTASPDQITAPQGFACKATQQGVTQCQAPGVLLYLKPIPAFYSSEHHPALCWQGSGYTLSAVRRDTLAGIPVYAGRLEGPQGALLTAWWYDNGRMRTLAQWDWRWRMLQGEPRFAIVNISVPAAGGDLEEAVRGVVVGY